MSGFDWRLDGLVGVDRRDARAVDQDVELATTDPHADEVSRQPDRSRHLGGSLRWVSPAAARWKAQLRVPVMSRSRSNIAATARHPRASTISSAPASPSASPRVGTITLKDISATMTSGGRLASTPSCWAARTSADRAEMAMPAQIDQPASNGVKRSWTSRWEPSNTAEAAPG